MKNKNGVKQLGKKIVTLNKRERERERECVREKKSEKLHPSEVCVVSEVESRSRSVAVAVWRGLETARWALAP